MSQPLNFGPGTTDPLNIPLSSIDQLEKLFHDSEAAPDKLLMGIEYEMFGQDRAANRPLQYEGPVSITTLFWHLVNNSALKADPFVPIMEQNNIVAIVDKRATIALEPGGQVEVAAKPHKSLATMNEVFRAVVTEVNEAASYLGIDLFAVGIHPSARQSDMAQVKKNRYTIMRNYMQGRAGLGLDMMTRTCSIQLNLDYTSEKDLVQKTRLGASLIPIFSLLCSSSAFLEGHKTRRALERGYIWQQTDHDRTGIPSIIFDENFGYRAWINWVLDVPMYFIRRNNTYIDVSGSSFRDFMAQGLKGEQASVRDFMDHMSTAFSEVRLKPFLELRSCDSLPVDYVMALSALTWGLFYDDAARLKALDMFKNLSLEELRTFHHDTILHGRAAEFRGQKIFELAKTLLKIAQDALIPLQCEYYLEPFYNLLAKNITCAEWLQQRYNYIDNKNLPDLIAHFAPLTKSAI